MTPMLGPTGSLSESGQVAGCGWLRSGRPLSPARTRSVGVVSSALWRSDLQVKGQTTHLAHAELKHCGGISDMNESIEALTLLGLLDKVGARTPAPGGGSVAGIVAALAGALAGMCARFSDGDQAHLARQANELRARATSLAQSDLAVYADYVRARRAGRDGETSAALDEMIRIPLEVAEVAAQLAELAGRLVPSGNPNLRGDATVAVLMGSAAARAGAVLVCENLADTNNDPRLARVAALVASVRAAEREVLSLYPALATP